jgi:sugar phosphate isomerase/epimerase
VRGQYRPDEPRAATEERAAESLREICRHAAPKGVRVALETVTILQTNFINTLAEAAAMIERAGCDNLRLMMDVFHLNIEEKSLIGAIRAYQDLNIHVHLADNNRRYPGQCGLSFQDIIAAFHASGYDGAFCAEILQLPDQVRAATETAAHLASIFHRVYGRPMAGKF